MATIAAAKSESIWIDTGPAQPVHAALSGDVQADVAVIGGGIVGITTALLLSEAGADVVLLEANQLGRGVSGHTTAKLSSQHGLIYDRTRVDRRARRARQDRLRLPPPLFVRICDLGFGALQGRERRARRR